jgi:hypothetical protein
MIVRILGEGQRDLPDSALDELNQLDDALQSAVDADDEARFTEALAALLDRVRAAGQGVPDEEILPSDLVLPTADATLAEVRALLGDEGLIPG